MLGLSFVFGIFKELIAALLGNRITAKVVEQAIAYVKQAAVDFETNEAKRAYVLQKLMGLGLSETAAWAAVHAAILILKKRGEWPVVSAPGPTPVP